MRNFQQTIFYIGQPQVILSKAYGIHFLIGLGTKFREMFAKFPERGRVSAIGNDFFRGQKIY
jgi:hypothetical protein